MTSFVLDSGVSSLSVWWTVLVVVLAVVVAVALTVMERRSQ